MADEHREPQQIPVTAVEEVLVCAGWNDATLRAGVSLMLGPRGGTPLHAYELPIDVAEELLHELPGFIEQARRLDLFRDEPTDPQENPR